MSSVGMKYEWAHVLMCCEHFGFSTSAWCRHLVEVYQNCTNATPLHPAGRMMQDKQSWFHCKGAPALKSWTTHPHELSWQDQDEQSCWRSNFWGGDAPLKTLLLGAKKVWQRMQVENHVSNHQPSNFFIEVQTIVRGNLVWKLGRFVFFSLYQRWIRLSKWQFNHPDADSWTLLITKTIKIDYK